jgi:hypothetical protein
MEDRSEWLALDFTQKLIKEIKKEYVSTAVNSTKGQHADPDNSDATQYMNGIATGNIGAYDRVMELIMGEPIEDLIDPEEAQKEYET